MTKSIPVDKICLETDRLILRGWQLEDLQDLYEYAGVPGVGEMAGWKHHENIETTKQILQDFIDANAVFALQHKATGKVIGSLGLHFSWANNDPQYSNLNSKEIGYVLSKDYWGQGLMVEALESIISLCFNEYDFDMLTCGHFITNRQSQRVIEKSGFRFAKNNTFHAKYLGIDIEVREYILFRSDWEDKATQL